MTTAKNSGTLTGARIVALVFVATLLPGCGKAPPPEAAKPTPVRIQRASNGPAVPPIDTSGIDTALPANSSSIANRKSARVGLLRATPTRY